VLIPRVEKFKYLSSRRKEILKAMLTIVLRWGGKSGGMLSEYYVTRTYL